MKSQTQINDASLDTSNNDKKRKYAGNDYAEAKKAKINLPLSRIRYYKNKICNLIAQANLHPTLILQKIVQIKANLDQGINFLCNETTTPHAELETKLLAAKPETDVILIIQQYLKGKKQEDIRLNSNDPLFAVLIAFFYYYMDFYRLRFNPELLSEFQAQLFIPLECYRRKQVEKQEEQSKTIIDEMAESLIDGKFNDSFKKAQARTEVLKKLPLADKQKIIFFNKLLKKLIEEIEGQGNTRSINILSYKIQELGTLQDSTYYLNHIALPLFRYKNVKVKVLGCKLLNNIYPALTEEDKSKVVNELAALLEPDLEKKLIKIICQTLSNMHLTEIQTDTLVNFILNIYKTLSIDQMDTIDNYLQMLFGLNLTNNQLGKIYTQLKPIMNNGSFVENLRLGKEFVHCINSRERDDSFYNKLIDFILENIQPQCLEILSGISIPLEKRFKVLKYLEEKKYYLERPDSLYIYLQYHIYKILYTLNNLNDMSNLIFINACKIISESIVANDFHIATELLLLNKNISVIQKKNLHDAILKCFANCIKSKYYLFYQYVPKIIKELSLNIDAINVKTMIANDKFPRLELAIQVLNHYKIEVDLEELRLLYFYFYFNEIYHNTQDDIVEINHNNNLTDEDKQKQYKKILLKYLIFHNMHDDIKPLDFFEIEKMLHWIITISEPNLHYTLFDMLINIELDELKYRSLRADRILSVLTKILDKNTAPNTSFEQFNFLAHLEYQNENEFSFFRYHIIKQLREQMTQDVLLNLIAVKYHLPRPEVIENIKQMGLR